MAATDTLGRAYAKLSDVKVGDTLIADAGFTCLKEGERCVVYQDADGDLCIPCRSGGHGLAGQCDDDGYLIGLYPADAPQGAA